MKTIAAALACVLVGSLTTVVAEDAPAPAPAKPEPFSFADFTWLNGNSRQKESILDSKYVTGEVRADVNYVYDFNNPKDHTLVGSSEIGRVQEFQVQQFGVGGDLHWANVRARLMTQFGMYSTMPTSRRTSRRTRRGSSRGSGSRYTRARS